MNSTAHTSNDSLMLYDLFINGRWQAGNGGEYTRLNPASEMPVARFKLADSNDAELAITAARSAFDSGTWSTLDGAERADILFKFAGLLDENQDRLGRLESMTHGAPLKYGRSFMHSAAQTFRYFAGLARDLPGHAHSFGEHRIGLTLREPIGVTSLILPWNFPMGELSWKVAPALAAGCTVVVKPDSKTAATALECGPLFKQAGLPDGVFNVLVGDVSEIGDQLTAHPAVDAVSFTGSSHSGRQVMESAARRVKPLHLELGGKSPLIIMDDADIQLAAEDAASGIFWHNGQVCTACSRLLVHEAIHDEFVTALTHAARSMALGDPLDDNTELGPLVGPEHLTRVKDYIALGEQEGAQLVLDGRQGLPDHGYYLAPSVFTDVTPCMTIAKEEIFGPVVAVIKVSDLDDAIAIANKSEYGLGSGIWTADLNRAMQAARRIRAGSFWINGYGSERLEMPWGGCKQSGFGRELGKDAFELFLQTKAVHLHYR